MRREIEEIPEAVARLLDGSGARARRGRARHSRARPAFCRHRRARLVRPCRHLHQICRRADRRPRRRLGRSVDRLDLWRASCRLDGSACLAISQSGKSPDIVAMAEAAQRRRRADHRHHQHRRFAAGRAPRTMRSTSWPAPERSVAATKSFVNSAVAGLALMAHCTGDDSASGGACPLAGAFRQGDRLRLDGRLAGALETQKSLFILGRGPSLGDRQRGGAEIQGNLRHACRGL